MTVAKSRSNKMTPTISVMNNAPDKTAADVRQILIIIRKNLVI